MTTERWNPQPGEPVVVFANNVHASGTSPDEVTFAKVDRVTKTLVVLDDGQRYKLRDVTGDGYLRQRADRTWSMYTICVYPVDHPNVPGRLNRARRERAISSACALARNLRGDLADGDSAKVIRAAAARLTELANIIEGTDQT